MAHIEKVGLKERMGLAQSCTSQHRSLGKKVDSGLMVGWGGRTGGGGEWRWGMEAGTEWFPSVSAVISQDNTGSKLSLRSSSCRDFFLLEKWVKNPIKI